MKKAQKIKDIDVTAIALVDHAATFRKFFITKARRKSMKKFLEILKSFFGEDLKEEEIAKAQGIEEDAQTELGDAITVLTDYRDDFPPDVLTALVTVTKTAVTPEEKIEEPDFVAELTSVDKAGARLSKATIAQLKKMGEIIAGMLGAAEKALKKGTGEEGELTPEITAQLEELATYKAADADLKKQKAETEKKEVDDKIAELTTEIEKLKKKKPTKKSLDGQGEEEDEDPDNKTGDEEEFQWTSLVKKEDEED